MITKGQLELNDYRGARLLHAQAAGWVQIVMNLFVIFWGVFFLLDIYFSLTGMFPAALMLPAIGLVAFFLIYGFILMPKRLQRIFSQKKELSAPFEMELDESGLKLTNEFGHTIRPWANFIKWKENKALFLLYHADVMYTIIPKRLFSDPKQVDVIRTHLEKNNIPMADSRSQVGCAIAIIFFFILFFIGLLSMILFNLRA